MKAPCRLFALAGLFALAVACWSGLGSSTAQEKKGKGVVETAPTPKWEYKVTVLEDDDKANEKELNKMGDEGWELVGTASSVSAPYTQQGSGRISTKVRLIFKRPKR